MKEPVTDLLGRRFSQLVVMDFDYSDGNQRYFRFRCDCGTEKTLPINQVKFGSSGPVVALEESAESGDRMNPWHD